jgi:hypothetical protein
MREQSERLRLETSMQGGQIHDVNRANKSIERLEQLRYLLKSLINQNSIHEKFKEQTEVRKCWLTF